MLLLVTGITLAGAAAARAQTNVLFIFDASGSMKAKVKGETRIAAAKKAMAAALREMPPEVRLGLMMYGHRRARDCTDIELVVPIGSEDAKTIDALVQKVTPRGETPIAEALMKASKSFAAFRGQQNTIVLVTDGMEECGGDPCAAARALRDAGLGLKVHIVGYMLDAAQRNGVACITAETGGRYFDASDPRSLTAALQEVRKEVVEAPRASASAPAPAPVVSATPVAPSPAPETLGLKVTALYGPHGRPVKQNVTYTVLGEKADLAGQRAKLAESYNGPPTYLFRGLPPGKYVLEASVEQIRRELPLEVPPSGSLEFEAVMDLADVRLDATLSAGGPVQQDRVTWRLLEPRVKLDGSRAKVAEFYNVPPSGVYLVPAGEWVLAGSVYGADYLKVEKPFRIAAGEEAAVTASFDAARVRLDAKLAAAGPAHAGHVIWNLLLPRPGLDGSRARIAQFYNVENGLVALLPAGEWVLQGRPYESEAVTAEKTVKIVAAEEQAIELVLDAGVVDLQALQKGAPYAGNVTWQAFQPAPTPAEPAAERKRMELYNTAPRAQYLLPAGTYRIVSVHGGRQ